MTVHELIAALLTMPNQNAKVTVNMWLADNEIMAVHCKNYRTVELDWRKSDGDN